MSPKFDECHWDDCTRSASNGDEQSRSSSTNFAEFSRTCSDVSTVKCASSAPKRNGYVYKRRKLHGNSVALLSKENATASSKGCYCYHSCVKSEELPLTAQKNDLGRAPVIFVGDSYRVPLENGNLFISGQHHMQKAVSLLSSQIKPVTNSAPSNICFVREDEVPAEASIGDLHNSASEHHLSINDRWSSSKWNKKHGSTLTKTKVEDDGQCSSSDVVESLGEFNSVKEMCVSVLKSHGLLGGVWTNTGCASLEVLCADDTKLFQSCKVCGLLENPLEMLICDLCEETFHLSCCNPKVKKLPVYEWYCQPCFRKKSKAFRKSSKSFDIMGQHMKRISDSDLCHISFMLKDSQPYTSLVRIGEDFQIEVPDWCGPIYDDLECFGEPHEVDPAKFSSDDGRTCNGSFKPSSIGNWIQCRAVIDEIDKGTICGKWRRAPLFVVQTDHWDCSCCVLWDPIHADCAVPQELETEAVLEHLKHVEMVRPQLADKKPKPDLT